MNWLEEFKMIAACMLEQGASADELKALIDAEVEDIARAQREAGQ